MLAILDCIRVFWLLLPELEIVSLGLEAFGQNRVGFCCVNCHMLLNSLVR